MAGVQFHKYSAYGNTFVVLDELDGAHLSEPEKSRFAPIAIDEHAGVGADNLLVVQRFDPEVLREIQHTRSYWDKDMPDLVEEPPQYIFRMFEPDGSEALCCGNGLLCLAMHLKTKHGIDSCSMLTEVPSPLPRVRMIGTVPHPDGFDYEVRIGTPRTVPEELMDPGLPNAQRGVVGVLDGLISPHQRKVPGLPMPLPLDAFITFTGEPHMVILEPEDPDTAEGELFAEIMGEPEPVMRRTLPPGEGLGLNEQLLHEVGMAVNEAGRQRFPFGVNVSFARLREEEQLVEYRCFERGVFKETLACGTAAVAVGVILRELGRMQGNALKFWPKRSRDNPFYAKSRIEVSLGDDGLWWLRGQARRIFDAELRTSQYPEVDLRPSPTPRRG